MPAKPTEKQITFFLEAEDRNQFQQLCKTTGISASMVLRSWVLAALKEQRIEMNVTPEATTTTAGQHLAYLAIGKQIRKAKVGSKRCSFGLHL